MIQIRRIGRVHVGRRRTGLNVVDGDAAGGEIQGQTTHQADQRGLGHRVGAGPGETATRAGDTANGDDSVTATHDPGAGLNRHIGGAYVDRVHIVERLDTEFVY
ncbi:hypothetical protein D3C84_677160 [compost metagenome]